jgi:NADPH-dependent 2,4-dienoyl-CoA reductase/sulfur reductase-like enzyme
MQYKYVIVGGGLTGASAIEGIRAHDPDGSILMVSRENHLPYHRPLLSKDLWFGKKTKADLPVHPDEFYREQRVEISLRREIVELDPAARLIWDDRGVETGYERLLLATGGRPRLLGTPGGDLEGVHYFRSLEDYLFLEQRIARLQHVLVIGGGFIAIELAAALNHAGKEVTLTYPHDYPLQRVLPRDLGEFVADYYREKGVETLSNDIVTSFEDQAGLIAARTRQGNHITTQIALVGIGIDPHVELAEAAGLDVGNGIEVDEMARTSDPHIYAAGDVAEFPYLALHSRTRVEHWDHAIQHGRAAGANMAGANRPYDTLPMFYSDFFDLGWEAVGELDATLEVESVWKEPYREGVLFYLREDVIRGVMLWNVWERVDWARDLIRQQRPMSRKEREELVATAGVR